MDKERIYTDKKWFVQSLGVQVSQVWEIGDAESIEYKHFPQYYQEFVRIKYKGGHTEYINVTGNNKLYILKEIVDALRQKVPVGLIEDYKHIQMIEEWWNDASETGEDKSTSSDEKC